MPTRHLRHSLRLAACLAVASLLASSFAHAASPAPAGLTSCTAAGCITPYWGSGQIAAGYGLPDGFRPGQTFTPKFTGVLTHVQLGLETAGAVNAVVEIRTTQNGLPTTTVLGSATVPGAPYTGGVLYSSASFAPQNLVLTAGTRYALTFTGLAPQIITVLAAYPPCHTSLSGANDYVHSFDSGQTWATLSTRDRSIIFEVCLDAATPTRPDTWGRVKAIYR